MLTEEFKYTYQDNSFMLEEQASVTLLESTIHDIIPNDTEIANNARELLEIAHELHEFMFVNDGLFFLVENWNAKLGADAVDKIFNAAAMMKKGIDPTDTSAMAKDAARKIQAIWHRTQHSKPVQDFDRKWDALGQKIRQSSGENSKLVKMWDGLGKLGKEKPMATSFIVAVGVTTATLLGSGGMGVIAGLMLRTALGLAKGERFSQAFIKGAKVSILAFLTGELFRFVGELMYPDNPMIPAIQQKLSVDARGVSEGISEIRTQFDMRNLGAEDLYANTHTELAIDFAKVPNDLLGDIKDFYNYEGLIDNASLEDMKDIQGSLDKLNGMVKNFEFTNDKLNALVYDTGGMRTTDAMYTFSQTPEGQEITRYAQGCYSKMTLVQALLHDPEYNQLLQQLASEKAALTDEWQRQLQGIKERVATHLTENREAQECLRNVGVIIGAVAADTHEQYKDDRNLRNRPEPGPGDDQPGPNAPTSGRRYNAEKEPGEVPIDFSKAKDIWDENNKVPQDKTLRGRRGSLGSPYESQITNLPSLHQILNEFSDSHLTYSDMIEKVCVALCKAQDSMMDDKNITEATVFGYDWWIARFVRMMHANNDMIEEGQLMAAGRWFDKLPEPAKVHVYKNIGECFETRLSFKTLLGVDIPQFGDLYN